MATTVFSAKLDILNLKTLSINKNKNKMHLGIFKIKGYVDLGLFKTKGAMCKLKNSWRQLFLGN